MPRIACWNSAPHGNQAIVSRAGCQQEIQVPVGLAVYITLNLYLVRACKPTEVAMSVASWGLSNSVEPVQDSFDNGHLQARIAVGELPIFSLKGRRLIM